jgi:hypothetical protein
VFGTLARLGADALGTRADSHAHEPSQEAKGCVLKLFDLTLPLDQVAEGYRAMDERKPIKTPLRRPGLAETNEGSLCTRLVQCRAT